MTTSWLARMGWDVTVLEGGFAGILATGAAPPTPPPDPAHRYKRPYEGTDHAALAMQAYLDWEFGLVGAGWNSRLLCRVKPRTNRPPHRRREPQRAVPEARMAAARVRT